MAVSTPAFPPFWGVSGRKKGGKNVTWGERNCFLSPLVFLLADVTHRIFFFVCLRKCLWHAAEVVLYSCKVRGIIHPEVVVTSLTAFSFTIPPRFAHKHVLWCRSRGWRVVTENKTGRKWACIWTCTVFKHLHLLPFTKILYSTPYFTELEFETLNFSWNSHKRTCDTNKMCYTQTWLGRSLFEAKMLETWLYIYLQKFSKEQILTLPNHS
jgi:hypothetical protein